MPTPGRASPSVTNSTGSGTQQAWEIPSRGVSPPSQRAEGTVCPWGDSPECLLFTALKASTTKPSNKLCRRLKNPALKFSLKFTCSCFLKLTYFILSWAKQVIPWELLPKMWSRKHLIWPSAKHRGFKSCSHSMGREGKEGKEGLRWMCRTSHFRKPWALGMNGASSMLHARRHLSISDHYQEF